MKAICSILAILAVAAGAGAAEGPRQFKGATPLEWSVRMADSEIARRGNKLAWKPGGTAKWDYTAGLFTLSLLKLNERVADARYVHFATNAIGSFLGPDGSIQGYKAADFNLDNLNPGKTVLALYRLTKEELYRKAAGLLRRQLDNQPRTTDGGFWHKQRYPHQMWLDGIYMAAPFYAEYATSFEESSSAGLEDVAKQIRLVGDHTFDPATGLFYHGWDESKQQEWADKRTGASSNFWGRAVGWYGMAMVDVLDFFPANHPQRPQIVSALRRLCVGVTKHQDASSGLWHQILDQGSRPENYEEATASCMFVYTLAKGVNRGYLSREFVAPAVKGYAGIVNRLLKVEAGGPVSLTQCCSVAGLGYGRDGSYAYYLKEPVIENDLKGVGPFILTGIQMQELLGLPMSIPKAAKGSTGDSATAVRQPRAPEWVQLPAILDRIQAPVFPAREFSIIDFGAAPGGSADCATALRQAIEACWRAGGGRVVVPAGEYLTGPIHLKSKVELHLEGGATLRFATNTQAYLPAVLTRFEGMECYNYSPFIYAFEQENVAVTGEGVLDGQASDETWWSWKGKKEVEPGVPNQTAARQRLAKMVEQGVRVSERRFGEGDYLRPAFVEFYRCRNVLIDGVRIRRSPMWELHPTLCTNVTVRGVDILSHGPNNDGCDPESCRDVLIENCVFDTGDDCIAIKSGRNNDGRRVGVPSENLVIRGCTMKDGHGGVVVGSEIAGGCRNVFAEDCRMDSPNLERALRLKSNAVRGGVIENVFMRNVAVGQVSDAVLQIDFLYEEGTNGAYLPVARNLVMENLTVENTPRVLNVAGFAGAKISGVRLYDCTFKQVRNLDQVKDAEVKLVGCTVEPAAQEDWRSLFDGRTLAGWIPMNDGRFLATNGCLRVLKSSGWLRSDRPYTNFVFEAEWKALETNYNSGFFLRAGLDGRPFPDGVWQVNLKATALGSLMKGNGTLLPAARLPVPVNQWTGFRMEVSGRKLALFVNGTRAWEFDKLDAPAGYIGLQAEGKAFDFRNLRIRELP